MTCRRKWQICSCLTLVTLAISALLLLPIPTQAESTMIQQTSELLTTSMTIARKYRLRSADFSVDKNGDVVMRCFNMSFVVAHNALDESPDFRDMMQDVHLQLTPDHNGINVKIGFAF
jgi:hypothetical protein